MSTKDGELRFLTPALARSIRATFGSPVYVYDEEGMLASAQALLNFPNAFGLTVRYAMKTNSNRTILRIFRGAGIAIDASSGYEVLRAMMAGYPGKEISLSSQEWFPDFKQLHEQGVQFNACSIAQIERFGALFPGQSLGIRVNPGIGSGGTRKTNVGGPSSSFGIWHEALGQARAAVAKYGLRVVRIHTHIGSGSDPAVWQRVADLSLATVRLFPEVTVLNLGGGFKVARMPNEKCTDLALIGAPVKAAIEAFAKETDRKLHLEIEPGTFLMANNGAILSTVQDVNDTRPAPPGTSASAPSSHAPSPSPSPSLLSGLTSDSVTGEGDSGFRFLKLDTGMTEILRPPLYGAQHPIIILPAADAPEGKETAVSDLVPVVFVGHCCETGDLLGPLPGEADVPGPRLCRPADIGDIAVIEGAGAYCASMSAKNYNSYPEAAEVLIRAPSPGSGAPDATAADARKVVLIRKRQTLEQLVANEEHVDL